VISPTGEFDMEGKNNQGDIAQIKTDLERFYILGHAEYDPDLYRQILHPNWKMFQLQEGNLIVIDRDEFCSWYEPQNQDPDLVWDFDILKVDVVGEVAQVKLVLENQKVLYVDYLHMMKIAGKWWIVHKIYHQVDKP
jgi:hypothetical protein